ncbi:MAG: hypothetical protein IIY94_02680 [Oscillospiraceae bacterium]|nr:hypothetical protein [Oscillospiraceae bacterium]
MGASGRHGSEAGLSPSDFKAQAIRGNEELSNYPSVTVSQELKFSVPAAGQLMLVEVSDMKLVTAE